MTKLLHYIDGVLYEDEEQDLRAYEDSLLHTLGQCWNGLVQQQQNPIRLIDAFGQLAASDLIVVVGKTWVGAFDICKPWHLLDHYCTEEFFGTRPYGDPLDMKDFIAGGMAVGKHYGAKWFEFGSRSNDRHEALGRYCRRLGVDVTAITLRKEIK